MSAVIRKLLILVFLLSVKYQYMLQCIDLLQVFSTLIFIEFVQHLTKISTDREHCGIPLQWLSFLHLTGLVFIITAVRLCLEKEKVCNFEADFYRPDAATQRTAKMLHPFLRLAGISDDDWLVIGWLMMRM